MSREVSELQRFRSTFHREFHRYWKIRRQTILTPLLTTYLYIGVFGAALGSRINELDGFPYITFIIPGLIMMAMAMNSFDNNASSMMMQRMMRAIDDQLSSPLSHLEMLMAYVLGGFVRGMIIATITLATASLLIDLPIADPVLFVAGLVSVGLFFSFLGVLAGVVVEEFDQLSLYLNFILQPLIFLGGVFYSVTLLPPFFETLSHFNPIFYMINMIRHGMLGTSDFDPWVSLGIVSAATLVLFIVNYQIFKRGYKLRM